MGSPWTTARLVHRTNLGEMSSEKKVVGKMRSPRDPFPNPDNIQGTRRLRCYHYV